MELNRYRWIHKKLCLLGSIYFIHGQPTFLNVIFKYNSIYKNIIIIIICKKVIIYCLIRSYSPILFFGQKH